MTSETTDKLDALAEELAKLRIFFRNVAEDAEYVRAAFEALDNAGLFTEIDEHTAYTAPEDILNIERSESTEHVTMVPPDLYDKMMADDGDDESVVDTLQSLRDADRARLDRLSGGAESPRS